MAEPVPPSMSTENGNLPRRVRVGSIQYWIRPVSTLKEFRQQVEGLVGTAADYGVRLLVFPEYFAIQLLTLNDVRRPIVDQVRHLAELSQDFIGLFSELAQNHGLYIAAGTFPVRDPEGDALFNDCMLFSPRGEYVNQGKLHLTRWEREDWKISPRNRLKIIETDFGSLAITICYDVEFPEVARAAAKRGASILLVPSCTDERQGFLRVRYCAHARAIENHMYVICSGTVGSLPMVPAVSLNYGQASILTPSDFPFARDGILAEGVVNQEMMVIADLNLETIHENRTFGSVLPLKDSERTAELVAEPATVRL